MKIIDTVNSPDDLKDLQFDELDKLAYEIRQVIIDVVSKNGGHLSSNLGVVELTIALHRVFKAPTDKIIWDVGHQCYTHKILTERKDRIYTIRQRNGLVGYPDIFESKYDALNTGHSSTSIAFASGMAIARDLNKKEHHIVPVIGDGALTGGVALEALNHIGQKKQKVIIILNDNEMSISPNVGGISKHLNYLVSGRPYIRLKEIVQSILGAIPKIGKSMADIAKKIETLARTMMVPGSLFDELGVKYIGPVNGHSIKEMEKEFTEAMKYDFPVLIHVVTKKGYGYHPAKENPSSFHSSAPFDIKNGQFTKKEKRPGYSKIFGKTVLDLIRADRKIVALTAAMPSGTGLDQVEKEFPDNFFDVGIAEQYLFDFAGGLALEGIKPIISIYSTFLQRAIDQIIHDIALMKLPIVVGIDRAGLVGGDGPTHQGIYDISLLMHLPNIILMAPKDEKELKDMIYTGIKLNKPVFIRYPKEEGAGSPIDQDYCEIPFGKAELIKKGNNGVVIAVGTLVNRARLALERLEREHNIKLSLINVRFLKPLDHKMILDQIRGNKGILKGKTRIITIEDGIKNGGLSTEVRELLFSNNLKNYNILSLGVLEESIEVASREELLAKYNLNEQGIYQEILRLF
jgi:1-deoxy-D-xylulose-5-phosphate synthase